MIGNISYLTDFKEHDGRYAAFGGGAKGATKDETSRILKSFITEIENLVEKKVQIIGCDNGTEFNNRVMNVFCKEKGSGPEWLFDIDALSKSMNYAPVPTVNTATPTYANYPNDPLMPDLKDSGIFDDAYDDRDEGAEADYNTLETVISVSPIPSTRIHKDHPKEQIIREVNSAVQTRKMAKQNKAGLITFINKQRRINHKDFQNCLFAFFLSQMEPKKVTQALDDESWVEAMQEELLQFKLLNVWTLVDLPHGKRAIRTKWVYRNKRNQRGIVVRNKARLVAQGHRQEEGMDYDEVFTPVAWI
nr:putative ribonuclease H-like domain-containing protein [Tanacetum cinerariifolium]